MKIHKVKHKWIKILSCLSTIKAKNDYGLYRDDGLLVLRNVNEQ